MIDNLFELFKKLIDVPDDAPQDDNAIVLAAQRKYALDVDSGTKVGTLFNGCWVK